MPLYEYKCTACHKHTEKIQKFSDPEITACPHCGGTLQRVITAPAIAFKGGGWYADGYGNAKPAAGESNPGTASSETTKSNDAAAPSTESKTATTESASAPAASPATTTSSTEKK